MRTTLSWLGLLVALGIAGACFAGIAVIAVSMEQAVQTPAIQPDAAPAPPFCPGPDCPDSPQPKPDKPRKPWVEHEGQSVGLVSYIEQRGGLVQDGPIHNGQEVQIDLPADILKRNIRSKGLGCCVFRSLNYAGQYNNAPELIDLPEKMVKAGIPGGGYPQKVDEIMKQFATNVKYLQVQNGDWEVVKLALKTGRCVAITYGSAHMVNLVKLENGVGAFRDNNLTGPNEIIWGTEEAVKQQAGGAHFWAVILLNGRPPAPPRSQKTIVSAVRGSAGTELRPENLLGEYRWTASSDGEQWLLWLNDRQVGAFDPAGDFYCELLSSGRWGKYYRRPPVPLPQEAIARLEAMPAGVEIDALERRECYSLCGLEISREQAEAAIIDDSAKLSLTAIGAKQETARVRADLERPEFATFRSHVIFQEYTPDDWVISSKRFGFDSSGHPTVYLETPAGDPLWHTNQYDGLPTMIQLRKADPNYKPDADPGMPNSPAAADGEWGTMPLLICMGGSGTFLLSLLGGALAIAHHLLELLTSPAGTEDNAA